MNCSVKTRQGVSRQGKDHDPSSAHSLTTAQSASKCSITSSLCVSAPKGRSSDGIGRVARPSAKACSLASSAVKRSPSRVESWLPQRMRQSSTSVANHSARHGRTPSSASTLSKLSSSDATEAHVSTRAFISSAAKRQSPRIDSGAWSSRASCSSLCSFDTASSATAECCTLIRPTSVPYTALFGCSARTASKIESMIRSLESPLMSGLRVEASVSRCSGRS
mmetsp:Transcript_42839/g.93884  ORF Transcript_42839/g.93884 Transcript_42839/m.93884 type:complete len:222 (-) Transcript_42839:254-919(-)